MKRVSIVSLRSLTTVPSRTGNGAAIGIKTGELEYPEVAAVNAHADSTIEVAGSPCIDHLVHPNMNFSASIAGDKCCCEIQSTSRGVIVNVNITNVGPCVSKMDNILC